MLHDHYAAHAPQNHAQDAEATIPSRSPHASDTSDGHRMPMRALPFETYLSRGEAAGLRWSLHRQNVLRTLWEADRPIGAYEIAQVLGSDGVPKHPTVIYRCLRALEEARLVISVISWKRFVISPDPEAACWGLLLCKNCRCHLAVDLTAQQARLNTGLAGRGFLPRAVSVEAEGLCRACQVH